MDKTKMNNMNNINNINNLRLNSGNIINNNIYKIGIIALGSYLENHGSVLPIDTDIKIASYIGLNVSIITGARFLGCVLPSTEYSYVKHGIHNSPNEVVQYIYYLIEQSKKIAIEKFLIINCHGGNKLIEELINKSKYKNDIIIRNITFTHASTEELSVGSVIGITNNNLLNKHTSENYPEIAMIGLKEARQNNRYIDEEAKIVEQKGIKIDEQLGKEILNKQINNCVNDIKQIISELNKK